MMYTFVTLFALHAQYGLHSYFNLQVCAVEFDRKDIFMNKLAATTLESKFHVFDLRTQHPQKGFAMLSEKVSMAESVLF